jgi:hypothetical protein
LQDPINRILESFAAPGHLGRSYHPGMGLPPACIPSLFSIVSHAIPMLMIGLLLLPRAAGQQSSTSEGPFSKLEDDTSGGSTTIFSEVTGDESNLRPVKAYRISIVRTVLC